MIEISISMEEDGSEATIYVDAPKVLKPGVRYKASEMVRQLCDVLADEAKDVDYRVQVG